MDRTYDDDRLREHLHWLTALDPAVVDRVIEEVRNYYRDTVESYVVRRHQELRQEGLNNPQIFQKISEELTHHRFCSPTLSERQIRRIIYG